MNIHQQHSSYRWGRYLGFLISYALFTTILFFILTFAKKLPLSWNYFHIVGITLGITLLGLILKKLLK